MEVVVIVMSVMDFLIRLEGFQPYFNATSLVSIMEISLNLQRTSLLGANGFLQMNSYRATLADPLRETVQFMRLSLAKAGNSKPSDSILVVSQNEPDHVQCLTDI